MKIKLLLTKQIWIISLSNQIALPFLWRWLIITYNVQALLEHSGRSSTGTCPVANVYVNTHSRCANLSIAIATNQHEPLYVGFFDQSSSEPNPQNTYRGESWLSIQFIAHLHHLQLLKAWHLQRHNMIQQACCPLNIHMGQPEPLTLPKFLLTPVCKQMESHQSTGLVRTPRKEHIILDTFTPELT